MLGRQLSPHSAECLSVSLEVTGLLPIFTQSEHAQMRPVPPW